MSGVISDNTGRSSGLTKAATTGTPDSGSSNPTVSTNPSAVGDRFINTTSGEMFIATTVTVGENVWKGQLGSEVKPTTAEQGGRGVWAGDTSANVIDYVAIASAGNATDFGNLITSRGILGATSNGSRAMWGGGS